MSLRWNLVLAVTWVALTGVTTLGNLLVGLVFGALVTYFVQHGRGVPAPMTSTARFSGEFAEPPGSGDTGGGGVMARIAQVKARNARLREEARRPRAFRKAYQVVDLLLFFLWELILSNIRIATDVVMPRYRMRPAIIAVPLDAKSDTEITLLANLVTLTPGTLSMDVSEDRSTIYIHSMYSSDRARFVDGIKRGFERRVLEVLR